MAGLLDAVDQSSHDTDDDQSCASSGFGADSQRFEGEVDYGDAPDSVVAADDCDAQAGSCRVDDSDSQKRVVAASFLSALTSAQGRHQFHISLGYH